MLQVPWHMAAYLQGSDGCDHDVSVLEPEFHTLCTIDSIIVARVLQRVWHLQQFISRKALAHNPQSCPQMGERKGIRVRAILPECVSKSMIWRVRAPMQRLSRYSADRLT